LVRVRLVVPTFVRSAQLNLSLLGSAQLQHPILKALEGSQYEWIKDLLFVFNAGDLGKYDTLQGRLAEEVSPGSYLSDSDRRAN
jgi:hypothetical protein